MQMDIFKILHNNELQSRWKSNKKQYICSENCHEKEAMLLKRETASKSLQIALSAAKMSSLTQKGRRSPEPLKKITAKAT